MSPAKGKKDENATSVTLQDGKATIKQKPLAMDKLSDTMQEIVRFREMVEKAPGPLEAIPNDHLSLIAKLAHERRAPPAATMLQGGLARNIRKLLLPDAEAAGSATSADRCPVPMIEKAITTLAERVNYGIDDGAASLCEWRWEVKDLSLLPEDLREKLEARRADRVKAKATLRALFDALPAEKREELLKKPARKEKGKGSKLHVQDVNQDAAPPTDKARSDKETTPAHVAEGEENRQAAAPPSEKKAKLEADPAKTPKDTAKKAAKAKEKEETKKSAAIFASFFKRPSGGHSAKSSIASSSAVKSEKPVSDFDATFHPFTLKKDATLAPVNKFTTAKYRQECQQKPDVIELNDDGKVVIEVKDEEVASSSATPGEFLKEFVSGVPAQYRTVPTTRLRGLKAVSGMSVKDVMDKINDAEEEGDDVEVARLQRLLKDRKRFPIKLLQYHEDVRPAYWGTWTKSSASVGPRTPFGQDAVFNYEYDSEEDWEEEPEEGTGEAIDDAMSVDSGDDDDDDADSWLAPDDEVEELEGSPPPLDDDPFLAPSPAPVASTSSSAAKPLETRKRKAATSARDDGKKKRKVVPLVPWIKGPFWEESRAKKDVPAALRAYRLRLLNDAPCSIDPFTWVSTDEPTIYVRRPPAAVVQAVNNPVPQTSAESSGATPPAPKKTQLAPSTTFPDEHVPYLLEAVAKHEGPLTVLCEKVYQDLRAHKVFKNCIEKKIRDISERKGRRWVVKPEAWTNAGVLPPQPS
ncbi:hypothetical protein AURDEDRAFT_157461 [Auricularia subglabra TFB-10046 SS5]|nr:hypothetical protein AURDEDRAFT_157461 [Auricularia subglabra TFB-10046 SS5]